MRESTPLSGAADIRQILDWLALPTGDDPLHKLDALRLHLGSLRERPPPPLQLHKVLDLLHEQLLAAANDLIPRFYRVRLPISPQTRRAARTLQDALELAARLYLDSGEDLNERLIKGLRREQDLTIWRAMHALGRHLFISNLISAPATPGIWQQLHQAMSTARRLKVEQMTPAGVDCSIMALYQRALLLGCAQPSAFAAHEWCSIERYAEKHAALVRLIDDPRAESRQSSFWVKPGEDNGPVAAEKRPPANSSTLMHFSCEALLTLLDEHRRQLGKGVRPEALGLPETLPTRLARGLLRRLTAVWGPPLKRRFPRRRQGYRTRLCFGFREVWDMLRGKPQTDAQPSEWMVTNESPDGYAAMHVSGKPHKVQNGDLVALRTGDTAEWQICIVRWALSENPEHLELGLQVLSPSAQAATLALPNEQKISRQPALLMPAVPPLRPQQSMATVPGLLMEDSGKLVLLVEAGQLEVREVKIATVQEQSPDIDVFAIDPDHSR